MTGLYITSCMYINRQFLFLTLMLGKNSKYLFNALFAAIILFVLIVQRWGPQTAITKPVNVWLETVKSGAATAIWIWLVIVRFPCPFPFSSSGL